MDLNLVFFSPTGTTGRILDAVSKGYGNSPIKTFDLTLPEKNTENFQGRSDQLTIFGVPVYEGRVAQTAVERIKRFRAEKAPAVAVVLYGNRDFEDALLELSDLIREQGFLPVAAGAFIGEHSFARKDRPMANGRPDDRDIEAAVTFGEKIRAKLDGLASGSQESGLVNPPGKRPYVEYDRTEMKKKSASTLIDRCTLCTECEQVCPVGAITVENDIIHTDADACILCNACVKKCPSEARVVNDPLIDKIVGWVFRKFQDRKEPVIFI